MIRKENTDMSMTRQCKLFKISRRSIYYTPVSLDPAKLDLIHEIDQISTKYPFFVSRQVAAYFPQSGFSAGRHRVLRLMNNGVADHLERPKYQQKASSTSVLYLDNGKPNLLCRYLTSANSHVLLPHLTAYHYDIADLKTQTFAAL